MTRLQILALAAAVTLMAASPLFAHHSWPVDFSKEVTVKGTVMDYNWGNPHVMFHMNVQDASGKTQQWNVGGPSTNRMAANGWDKQTLKPGDVITATGYQFTDRQPVLRLNKIVTASGKELFLYGR
jgi:hypothetical protein